VSKSPQVTIDGKPAYLYKVGIGAYSDYSEEWWHHERQMAQDEMIGLLLEHVGAVESEWAAWSAARNARAQELFGCDAIDIGWKWGQGKKRVMTTPKGTSEDFDEFWKLHHSDRNWRVELMARTGFVLIEPTASYWTDEVRSYNEPGTLRRQVEYELEQADARTKAGE
jgi:hypothetical protein